MEVPKKVKIVFVVTEDWAFLSHRLPMAKAASDLGFEVVVFTHVGECRTRIEDMGYRVIPAPFDRRNINPLRELITVFALIMAFWQERPDIVHNVSLKPILDGTFAALFCPVRHIVNTFTGLKHFAFDLNRFGIPFSRFV